MDILGISFTGSGNEVFVRCDERSFDIARADFVRICEKYLGASHEFLVENDDMFPIFADEKTVCELIFLDEKLKVIKHSLYLLGISDKSERMLREKLRIKGFSGAAVDAALAVVKKNGYLCDESFCRRKCEILAGTKLFGRRRLITELMAKGFSQDLCIRTVDDAEIDYEENLKLLFEKISKGRIPENREQKKKLSDKLIRHGYSYDEISVLFDEFEIY